jgi:GntR family transcriptional regulator of arabinose operon
MPKHEDVCRALRQEIQQGRWKPGDRLPSEADLVERFGVSRITIGRAVRDLQQAGLVSRRAGSGTFVQPRTRGAGARSFGLLIPDLGDTEIFESICQGMMASPLAAKHALLWGSGRASEPSTEDRAWALCQQYVERRVSGVFFAPLEWAPDRNDVNQRIGRAFDAAGIPVVLLDRPLEPYPHPGRHDVVGIDNWRAGFQVADHLFERGCRRVAFVGRQGAAPTVDAREAGYREAVHLRGADAHPPLVVRIPPEDTRTLHALMDREKPDGIACANDRIAAHVMRTLLQQGVRIPGDIRLAGIDDVDYAPLLPVPLTTLRQPTRQIGDVALAVMLDRLARPDLPARHVQLQCELIRREST